MGMIEGHARNRVVPLVDRKFAARLEAVQAWRAINYAHAAIPNTERSEQTVEVAEIGSAQMIFAGAGLPVNRTFGLGMKQDVADDHLDAVEAFYTRHALAARIDLCPLADQALIPQLAIRGYHIEKFYNVLFCPLPTQQLPHDAVSEIKVTQAQPTEADLWITTSARGFESTETPSIQAFNVLRPNFYSENAHCYFARIGYEAAGTGAMYLHDDIAEFGGTSTRVAYRQRGIQTSLLIHRLRDATTAGCDAAIIVTSPAIASQRNAERIGFRLAYTKATLIRPLV